MKKKQLLHDFIVKISMDRKEEVTLVDFDFVSWKRGVVCYLAFAGDDEETFDLYVATSSERNGDPAAASFRICPPEEADGATLLRAMPKRDFLSYFDEESLLSHFVEEYYQNLDFLGERKKDKRNFYASSQTEPFLVSVKGNYFLHTGTGKRLSSNVLAIKRLSLAD